MESSNRMGLLRATLGLQAAYFFLTGLWSVLAPGLFQKVTGPKTDIWLLKTVGVLVMAIAAAQASAARRHQASDEALTLGVGSALGLTGIDVVYVARGRISPVYLFDAAIEAALAVVLFKARGGQGRSA
jgi:hypothetical protein